MDIWSHTSSPLRVLLIDDSEDDAIITHAFLENSLEIPLQFDWVSTFQEGLDRIQANQHDIDLLDYQLGKHSGIELLEALPSQSSHAPIIMLTGHGNETLAAEALRAGAIDYVPKRLLTTDYLQRVIEHALERSRFENILAQRQRQIELANRELLKRNEEIQRFYHVLAHELKTPLTAALEFVQILQEGIVGPINSEQQNFLSRIDRCCLQLGRNINDLYDATKLETGKLSLILEPDDLGALIHQVIACLQRMAQTRGLSLQAHIAPHLPKVMMDHQRIHQVITNLLENAIKFTPQGGSIFIETGISASDSSIVECSVRDTGIGIPPDQHDQIFARLHQVADTRHSSISGLGLGLYICQELLKLHGTCMHISSQLGQGSTFSFTLKATEHSSKTQRALIPRKVANGS